MKVLLTARSVIYLRLQVIRIFVVKPNLRVVTVAQAVAGHPVPLVAAATGHDPIDQGGRAQVKLEPLVLWGEGGGGEGVESKVNGDGGGSNSSPLDLLGHQPPLECMWPSHGLHAWCLDLPFLCVDASICVNGTSLIMVLHSGEER